MKKTIITVVGNDTVGIIAKVCTYLAENQVNILDISQMCIRDSSSIPQETALVIQRLIRYNDITFWEIFPQSGANCEAGSQKRLIIWENPLL